MTDREMLELAAKAAGHALQWGEKYDVGGDVVDCTDMAYITNNGVEFAEHWNPLADDGDALRLAVNLGINLEIGEPGFGDVQAGRRDHWACEWLNPDDPCSSVRLAITRAAAEIGRAMG